MSWYDMTVEELGEDVLHGRANYSESPSTLDPWFPDDILIAWMQTAVVMGNSPKLPKAANTKLKKRYEARLSKKHEREMKAYVQQMTLKNASKSRASQRTKKESEKRFFRKLHILRNASPTITNAMSKKPLSKTWPDEPSHSSTLIRKTEKNFRRRVAKMRARRAKAVAEAAQENVLIITKKKQVMISKKKSLPPT